MPKQQGIKEIAQNRKAFHDYFVLEKYEAGIELAGTEVKSVRAGQVNMKDSYCSIKNGELFLRGMHISPYEKGNIFNRDPVRVRRLLMHKREINRLNSQVMQQGVALIPLSLYFKDSKVKVEIYCLSSDGLINDVKGNSVRFTRKGKHTIYYHIQDENGNVTFYAFNVVVE